MNIASTFTTLLKLKLLVPVVNFNQHSFCDFNSQMLQLFAVSTSHFLVFSSNPCSLELFKFFPLPLRIGVQMSDEEHAALVK